MSSFARRVAITIAIPLALYLAGEHLLLPGIPAAFIERTGVSRLTFGVLALGLAPILNAYWMVEVSAFLVPRWSRLRHGNPEGRAKLDRAARILALVLATFQAFGIGTQLEALQRGDLSGNAVTTSVPVVVFTLVGGVCLQFVAARFISQRGLVNGFVVLLGATHLVGLGENLMEAIGLRSPSGMGSASARAHAATPRELAFTAFGLLAIAFATWLVVGRPSAPPAPAPGTPESSAPYRGARQLVVQPWIPLPASSLQAYLFATAILMFPATLAVWHVPGSRALQGLLSTDAFLPIVGATTIVVMVVFARLMHRPAELSDLALRLGAKARGQMQEETRAALRRALVPTAIFFVVVVLAPQVSRVSGLLVPMIVVAGIEIVRSMRGASGMVMIWEERRASAVPVLRAALAADGIPSEARGMAMLSLWQVFAPYAPAEILVREEDAERATMTLRHWLLGEEAPERAKTTTESLPTHATETPWPVARRNMVLGGTAAAALAAFALFHLTTPSFVPTGPRPKLEIVRVDDSIDPFATLPEDAVPSGQGFEIRFENAPAGNYKTQKVNFARVTFREGESKAAATARFRRWLSSITLPTETRFGLEEIGDYDEDTKLVKVTGLRTFVLTGPSVLQTEDVTDAMAMQSRDSEDVYVTVTLSEDGGKRFEDVTREWTQRRIAILVDDEINSAPVVKTTIHGGRVSITMGAGDPEKKFAEATALSVRLRGR